MTITILLPVLNEIEILEPALLRLRKALEAIPEVQWQVIVADGGSQDGGAECAECICQQSRWHFVREVLTTPSVGKTIALGMKAVIGEWILILPVDCSLPKQSLRRLFEQIKAGQVSCGGFRKKYEPNALLLQLYASLQNGIRSAWFRHLVWTNGIFFRARWLKAHRLPITGFLEDVLLSDQLRKQSHWKLLDSPIYVSARRYYPNRVFRRIFINLCVMVLFRTGWVQDPLRLRALYSRT